MDIELVHTAHFLHRSVKHVLRWNHHQKVKAQEENQTDTAAQRANAEGDQTDGTTTTKAESEMQRRLLLDVVIRQRKPFSELLPCEGEALLTRGGALRILDLLLHIRQGIARFDVERDCLPGECLDEDLHRRVIEAGAVCRLCEEKAMKRSCESEKFE